MQHGNVVLLIKYSLPFYQASIVNFTLLNYLVVAKVSSIQPSCQDDYLSFQSLKVVTGPSSCSALEKESDAHYGPAVWICSGGFSSLLLRSFYYHISKDYEGLGDICFWKHKPEISIHINIVMDINKENTNFRSDTGILIFRCLTFFCKYFSTWFLT